MTDPTRSRTVSRTDCRNTVTRTLNSTISSTLSATLIFQLAFAPLFWSLPALAQSNPNPSALSAAVQQTQVEVQADFESALQSQPGLPRIDETRAPTRTPSLHFFADQVHRVYDTQEQLVAEYALSRIDISNPPVVVTDAASQLRFAYDQNAQEFIIQKITLDKTGKARVTDAHVFRGVTLTAAPILDSAMALFATPDGVHAILTKHLVQSFGNKPIVSPVVLPADPTRSISKLEFLSPATPVQDLGSDVLFDGDLLLHFAGSPKPIRVPRSEAVLNLGTRLLGFLALVQGANPDLDQQDLYQKVFEANAQDLAEFLETQRGLLDGPQNDLVVHALRAWGQKLNYEELGLLLEKGSDGKNQFQRLADAPRHAFSPSGGEQSSWQKQNRIIIEGQQTDLATSEPTRKNRSWRQILLDHYQTIDNPEAARKSAEAEQKLQRKMWGRIQDSFQRVATKKRLAMTAVALTAVGANQALGGMPGEWLFEQINLALNWSAKVPLLGNLTGPIAKSLNFFTDPAQKYGMLRLIAGTAAVMALNPLSYAVAKFATARAKTGWDPVRAFFTYGTRAYAKINYPIQKLLFWDRLRQKGLYEAVVENKANPVKHPSVLNNPFASKSELEAKPAKVNQSLELDAVRKGRALLLAAAIVSESRAQAGHAIDIAALLMAQESKSVEALAQLLNSTAGEARWTELTAKVYEGLVALGDQGGEIDAAEVQKYVSLFQSVAEQYQNPSQTSLGTSLKKLYRRSQNLMSAKLLPFLVFGKQWYEVYQRYSKIELSKETLESAKHNFNDDYQASAVIYALTEPKKFAEIPIAGLGAPEVITNQLSQVFVYGVQGAIDPPDTNPELPNPNAPLIDERLSQARENPLSARESLQSLKPRSTDYLKQHAAVMGKLFEGFQVRFIADYLTRTVGLFLTLYLLGENPHLGEIALKSVQLSTFFLVAKISFQWGPTGFTPGYATIWPYIQMSVSKMQGAAAKNRARLNEADYLITTGIDLHDPQMAQRGVRLYQEIYQEKKIALPSEWTKSSETFTLDEAKQFLDYTLKKGNTPLPTTINKGVVGTLNWSGAVISTILFAGVSAVAMDPNTNASEVLLKSLGWFAITYAGLTVGQKVGPKAKHWLKSVTAPVVDAISDRCNLFWKKRIH